MVKKINDVQDVEAKPAAADPLAGLQQLEDEALQGEQQGQQARQQQAESQQQQETDTLAQDLGDALNMAASMAQPALWWLTPEQFEQYWGQRVRAGIAASGAEIMRRHGISMGDMLTQYGPYIALAAALGPSTLATVQAYKVEKQRQLNKPAQGGTNDANQTG